MESKNTSTPGVVAEMHNPLVPGSNPAVSCLQELLQKVSEPAVGNMQIANMPQATQLQTSSTTSTRVLNGIINQRQGEGTSDLISLLQCSNPRSNAHPKQSIKVTHQSMQISMPGSAMGMIQPPPNYQQVVYVRPLGAPQNSISSSSMMPCSNSLEALPFPPSNQAPMVFGNPFMVRGLSPQRNMKPNSYPAYLPMHPPKIENSQIRQSIISSSQRFSTVTSNIVAGISTAKRNLEIALGGQFNAGNNENGQPSSNSLKRVRMGWNPAKRKLSHEKSSTPPPVLVISSDEEDEVTKSSDKSATNSGARLGFLNGQKSASIISDRAVHIAMRLPSSSSTGTEAEPNSSLRSLDYGLSILDNPQRLLDTLEEVLRDRPKRLRVNLRSLYSHCKMGCLSKVLSMLLEDLSPAASVHSEDGKSALHAAASKGHLDVLVVLVYKAAGNIDVTDKFKRTPLYIAVEKGHFQAAQFLHRAGASLASKNFDGMGLLHVAAHKGHLEILSWLLTLKKDLNEQDNGGWTSLMWAAEDGNAEALKLLARKGARTDLRDKEQNTVLHWASMAGAIDGCETLLNTKCDINCVNMYGDTPLHIAAREGNLDIVKLFLLRGSDTSVRNKEDKMPMDRRADQPGSQHHYHAESSVEEARRQRLDWSKRNKLSASSSSSVNFDPRMVCVNNPQVRDTIRLRHAIGHVTIRRRYDCDISRGKERIPVSCVNEVDDEPLPLNFTYISEPVESHTVSVMKDLLTVKGCKCQISCSLESCECIQRNEESKFWFDEGVLDMKFLDLDQPVLVECSKLCRCWSYCGNRVVQKGIHFRLEVFKTNNMGWGLRTICPIPKGSFVLSYVGEVISDDEADRRADDSYLFDLDMKNSNDEDNCLDANFYGNCGRFINHSCESNLVPVRVFTHHRDWRFPGIAFFASRDMDAYEALSFDYGDKFWEIKKKSGLRCQCNSICCKYLDI